MLRKVPAGLTEELVPDARDLLQEPADLAVLGVAGTGLQGHEPLGRDDDLGLAAGSGGQIAVGVVSKSREEVVLGGWRGGGRRAIVREIARGQNAKAAKRSTPTHCLADANVPLQLPGGT